MRRFSIACLEVTSKWNPKRLQQNHFHNKYALQVKVNIMNWDIKLWLYSILFFENSIVTTER